MGLISRLRNLLRVQHDDPSSRQSVGWLMPAGIPVTLETALRVSALYACVSRIAKAVAASPVNVFAYDGKRRELLPQDNVAYLLNTRPNPEQVAEKVRYTTTAWALLEGNGYMEIQRDLAGRPCALWPLFSDRMTPVRVDGELVYRYFPTYGGNTDLPPADVFHLAGPGLGQLGDETMRLASNALALSIAAEQFNLSYFQNGAQLAGFFEYPGSFKDPKKREALEKQYAQLHSGGRNAFHTIVLEGGMKYQALSVKASDAQVAELREFQLREVARFFDVPLALLQTPEGAQGYGSNIAALWDIFTKTCVKPWALRWQQEAEVKLFAARGPWRKVELDLSWLTRGDAEARARAYEIMRRIGVDSVNDILEQEGRNAIGPEGDVRLVPNTFTTIEGIQKQVKEIGKKPPAPPPPPPPGQEPDPQEPTKKMPMEPTDPGSDAAGVAREAIVALVAGAGDRYQRRLANRKTDLERRHLSPEQIASNLTEERAKSMERLAEDCADAARLAQRINGKAWTASDLAEFGDAMDAGKAAVDAAIALLARMDMRASEVTE